MTGPRDLPAVDTSKRRLLAGGAAVGVLALAPGVTLISTAAARQPGKPASSKVRWGMLIDTRKNQNGWQHMIDACRKENGWQGHGRPETDPQWIREVNLKDKKTGAAHSLPVMCQHCENPPCVDVCPTGASMKRADGIVLVDRHTCIGCRYCMMACPYGARSFVHEPVTDQKPHMPRGKGTVESCTLCVHRIDQDRVPACVEADWRDGNNAILFGDLNDPESNIAREVARYVTSRIRADLGVEPGILYRGL
ncbi:MAG: 4Fe-4S dicluster domain-containing protein [Rhodospirillales bacterium]|nr:4Fe-4S dicluster domain-containing protein [Rhodospirillales bacterium]